MYARLIAKLPLHTDYPSLSFSVPLLLRMVLVTVDLRSLEMSSVAGNEPLAPPASGLLGANHHLLWSLRASLITDVTSAFGCYWV